MRLDWVSGDFVPAARVHAFTDIGTYYRVLCDCLLSFLALSHEPFNLLILEGWMFLSPKSFLASVEKFTHRLLLDLPFLPGTPRGPRSLPSLLLKGGLCTNLLTGGMGAPIPGLSSPQHFLHTHTATTTLKKLAGTVPFREGKLQSGWECFRRMPLNFAFWFSFVIHAA